MAYKRERDQIGKRKGKIGKEFNRQCE
jgi:hypothetical protein